MKKIFIVLLGLFVVTIIVADSFTIQYKHMAKSIAFYTVRSAKTDKDGNIILEKTFPINIKIRAIRIYKDGRYLPIRYSKKKKYIIIKNTGIIAETVDVFLDYSIEMKVFRDYILPGINIYFPLYIFEPQYQYRDEKRETDCYVELPKGWSLLSPLSREYINTNEDDTSLYQFKSDWQDYPVIMTGQRLFQFGLEEEEDTLDHKFNFYGKERIKFLFKNDIYNKVKLERLNSYVNYLEEYFGVDLNEVELNFILYVGILNIALSVDDAVLLSGSHFINLSNIKENNSNYEVLYELAYTILRNRIDYRDFDRDSWIVAGMCHMACINYFEQKYELGVNSTNSNKFIRFLLGNKDSNYTRSAAMFRDFIRFRKIKSLLEDNTPKLFKYNYRARALHNRYSIQAFYCLKNMIGDADINEFIVKVLVKHSDSPINTWDFLDMVKEEYGIKVSNAVSQFVMSYPVIDLGLKVNKDGAYLLRHKGKVDMPVELLYVYKDNHMEHEVVFLDSDKKRLDVDMSKIWRISVDPDSLIDEEDESNNFYGLPVNFSFLAPLYTQDSYTFSTNVAMVSYSRSTHFGLSTSGAWNMKGFTPNTLTRPTFLWGIDAGYGYYGDYYDESVAVRDKRFNNAHNAFVNAFFETSLNPKTVWAPHFYTQLFFHSGEALSYKLGLRNFIPPVINTEHDDLYFNHSVDMGWDIKYKYHAPELPEGMFSIDMNINAGYKFFFRFWFYTLEGILAVNVDFDGLQRPQTTSGTERSPLKDVTLAGHLENKFDFRLVEFAVRAGIMKGFLPRRGYEYYRPKITRFNLVTQSIGYYELISNNLTYANNLISDNPYPTMDFFFLHHYFLFKINLLSEPLLKSIATIGFGLYLDFHLPLIFEPGTGYQSQHIRSLMTGVMLKIDIMRKTSVILRFAVFPLIWKDNRMHNLLAAPVINANDVWDKVVNFTFFEVRSFL